MDRVSAVLAEIGNVIAYAEKPSPTLTPEEKLTVIALWLGNVKKNAQYPLGAGDPSLEVSNG